MDHLEIDPELDVIVRPLGPNALTQILPSDFPLAELLQFLPDVRLKERVEALADRALAVDVRAEMVVADELLAALRAAVKDAEDRFKYPVDLAHQLHKRLTGLRADFTERGTAAIRTVGQRVYAEQQRRAREAEAERRRAQEAADAAAKEAARREAERAAAAGTPAPVVEQLKRVAERATAPPVPVAAPAKLRNSTTVTTWKARLQDSDDAAEPNPDDAGEMDAAQQAAFRRLVHAVATEQAPLACLRPNWPVLNARAEAEKSTLDIPGVEAYEVGGVRSKGGRR